MKIYYYYHMCAIIQRGTWLLHTCTFRANIVRLGRRSPVICSCSAMCPIFVLQRWFLWYVYTVYFCGVFSYIYSHYTRICILHKDSIRFTLWFRFSKWYDLIQTCEFCWCFSSSEPKAQVSFSEKKFVRCPSSLLLLLLSSALSSLSS